MEKEEKQCKCSEQSCCCEHDEPCNCHEEAAESNAKQPEQEIALLKDTLLRMAAEFENAKKRFEREKEDTLKYANIKFAKDLLSVLDNFDLVNQNYSAIQCNITDSSIKAVFDGIALCEKELLSTFRKHKIEKIQASPGEKFDHTYHQAMCEVNNDECDNGCIVNVMQAGYMCDDRLIRPAMVTVSKKTNQ